MKYELYYGRICGRIFQSRLLNSCITRFCVILRTLGYKLKKSRIELYSKVFGKKSSRFVVLCLIQKVKSGRHCPPIGRPCSKLGKPPSSQGGP